MSNFAKTTETSVLYPRKFMLKILLKRLQLEVHFIFTEEQAGFRTGRGTVKQIFNLHISSDKYWQHQKDLFHVFIDFKKAFNMVLHNALWATMRQYSMRS